VVVPRQLVGAEAQVEDITVEPAEQQATLPDPPGGLAAVPQLLEKGEFLVDGLDRLTHVGGKPILGRSEEGAVEKRRLRGARQSLPSFGSVLGGVVTGVHLPLRLVAWMAYHSR